MSARCVLWNHSSRLHCTASSRILPFFIVSSLKRDALSAELMMALRSEMLSYEVMWGLPNAYLDCTNAQWAAWSGSLPVTYWWCSCLGAGAVTAWPHPQPPRSSLLAPVLVAAGRCLSPLSGCSSDPLPTLPGKPKHPNNTVLVHYPAACCECPREMQRQRWAGCEDYFCFVL